MSELQVLLAAMLNQDWPDRCTSVWAAVAPSKENSPREELASAHGELVAVLDRGLSEHQLDHDIMDDVYGTGYRPAGDGMTVTEFLTPRGRAPATGVMHTQSNETPRAGSGAADADRSRALPGPLVASTRPHPGRMDP